MTESSSPEQNESSSKEENNTSNSLFSFEGRVNRGKFWLVLIPLFLISFGLQVGIIVSMDNMSRGDSNTMGFIIMSALFYIPALWILIATYVKRWHDLDKSGWWSLILLIPWVNLLIILYLGLAPGTVGANRYEEQP